MSNLQVQLAQLREQIFHKETTETWKHIEQTCHQLGNTLRVKDPDNDNHAALGNTLLPQHLKDLFSLALHQHSTPADEFTSVTLEILRVAANLCMDHDENRGHLLEALFPQTVVAMLEGYVENSKETRAQLSIPHLKVARTAMGVLLNLSIGYEPVKSRLKSLEVAQTILSLSSVNYVPGDWLNHLDTLQDPSSEELWTLRTGLANWTWRVISELQDDDSLQIFSAGILPLLTPPLLTFIPPNKDTITLPESPLVNTLIRADFETLEESCTLIESLSLDVQDVRLALARGLDTPAEHGGIPCLWNIVDFVEMGDYSKLWSRLEGDERRLQKAFDMCKTACIKAIVEVAGEEGNSEVIWDESNEAHPGGAFVERMVGWVKKYASAKESEVRDDLIICASLSLGNLARREVHARVLLSPPHTLAPVILSPRCLSISTDTKLKHGVLGLLRHLAQSTPHNGVVHEALTKERVVYKIAESGVWDEKADAMAEVVQVSAIGVIKAVCNASADNTFMAILPTEVPPTNRPTTLEQLLALVKRADTVTIKSEGTRAIVNMVRSLWASTPGTVSAVASPIVPVESNADSLEKARKRQDCIKALAAPECVLALAALIERSSKHPLLINEGVVALSLLGSHPLSSSAVLQALIKPVGTQSPQPSGSSVSTDVTLVEDSSPSSNTSTRRALDMLATVIECPEKARFPIEVRINSCSLLTQISRNNTEAPELQTVKDVMRDVISALVEKYKGHQGKEGILAAAAQKLLTAWA